MDELMRIQQEISEELQAAYVGRTLEVLIDEQQQNEEGLYLGRSQYDAPEVDGLVYVQSARPLRAGEFVQVKILDALAYDLVGEAL